MEFNPATFDFVKLFHYLDCFRPLKSQFDFPADLSAVTNQQKFKCGYAIMKIRHYFGEDGITRENLKTLLEILSETYEPNQDRKFIKIDIGQYRKFRNAFSKDASEFTIGNFLHENFQMPPYPDMQTFNFYANV